MREINPEKLKYYNERYAYWTNAALSQLSFTNNLLLTISIAFLSFSYDNITYPNSVEVISISLNAVSIFLGLCVVFCRLYSFRITRRLSSIRKRIYNKKQKLLKESEFNGFNICTRINAFLYVIFIKLPTVKNSEIECFENNRVEIIKKFEKLDILSKKLGNATWVWTKTQALFFILGILSYTFILIN